MVETVRRLGGVLKLDGDNVRCSLPRTAAYLVDELRERKPELIALLKARGGWIATTPRCSSCASYALYRKDNIGTYECMTCDLKEIEEVSARRLA